MNMIKVLWCRFQRCFGTFIMLLVERFSQTGLLGIYITMFSESVISKIQKLWGSFFFKRFEILTRFEKCSEKLRVFCLWDNCIWIGIIKLSLLRTGYLSSAANVLTSSPNVWHVNKGDFFHLHGLSSDQWFL